MGAGVESYQLADSVSLFAALMYHHVSLNSGIFFNFSNLGTSTLASSTGSAMAESIFVALSYFMVCNRLKFKWCSNLVSTVILIGLLIIDATLFFLVGSSLNAESLSLLFTHPAIILKNVDMLPRSSLASAFSAVVLTLCLIGSMRLVVKTMQRCIFRTLGKIFISLRAIWWLAMVLIISGYIWSDYPQHSNPFIRLLFELSFQATTFRSRPIFVTKELRFFENEKTSLLGLSSLRPRKSLFVITLESVRACSFSAYNREVPSQLTPFLSSLVHNKEARVVDMLQASVSNTMKVLYSSMCGVPSHPGVEWLEYAAQSPYLAHCLPKLLRDMGWSTIFLTASSVGFQPRLGFEFSEGGETIARNAIDRGEHQPYSKANFLGYDERIIIGPLKNWLSSLGKNEPGFAVIGTVSTHAPYTVANASRAKRISIVVDRAMKSFHGDSSKSEEYAAYLAAIHDTDDFLKETVEAIDQSPQGKDAVIVIIGDHGEAFGEHESSYFHGGVPFSETSHVPCYIIDRSMTNRVEVQQQIIPRPWSTLSLRWTFLDLLGFPLHSYSKESNSVPASIPFPHPISDSSRLQEVEKMSPKKKKQLCSAFSSSLFAESVISCSTGDLKFIKMANPSRVAVFNVTLDPLETIEVSGISPSLMRSVVNEMASFRKIARERHREIRSSGVDFNANKAGPG
jgi:phosphoglycerol transferase MdoB-like AlkP superfamily enzyme